jgi:hypothetical protein
LNLVQRNGIETASVPFQWSRAPYFIGSQEISKVTMPEEGGGKGLGIGRQSEEFPQVPGFGPVHISQSSLWSVFGAIEE